VPREAILSAENGGNLRAVGALPRIPLEELTALRRSLAGGEEVAALFPRTPPPAHGLRSWLQWGILGTPGGVSCGPPGNFFLYQIKHWSRRTVPVVNWVRVCVALSDCRPITTLAWQ